MKKLMTIAVLMIFCSVFGQNKTYHNITKLNGDTISRMKVAINRFKTLLESKGVVVSSHFPLQNNPTIKGPIFQLYLYDSCMGKVVPFPISSLRKITCPPLQAVGGNIYKIVDKLYNPDNDDTYSLPGQQLKVEESGIIQLPDTGWYQMTYCYQKVFYHFTENHFYKDTVNGSKITKVSNFNRTRSRFYSCSIPCQGKTFDYYPDGAVRMSGVFRTGRPLRKLFYFSNSGTLSKVEIYSKQGRLVRTNYKTWNSNAKPLVVFFSGPLCN